MIRTAARAATNRGRSAFHLLADLPGAAYNSMMALTDAERRAFDARGFFVLRGLFREEEVARARAALDRLYATAQSLRTTGDHRGAFFVLDAKSPGPVVVQRVVWAGGMEPTLLTIAEDSRLLDPALELLGSPSCEQLLCQAHFKMPNDGVAFDWHQDIQHRDKGPGTWRDLNGRGSYVQTLLLIDDMTEENGPLEFLPQDAAELDARGRLIPGTVRRERATSVTGRAGDVLFFGPHAIHGSTPNSSPRPRRVLINGFAFPGANGRTYPGDGACRVLGRRDPRAA